MSQTGTHDHSGHPEHSESSVRWTADFWDERYAGKPALWSGSVNAVVAGEVADLPPGRALDVGCGEGGDALWLAGQGWDVTGADVSVVALERAAARAVELGREVVGRTRWEQADLLGGWAPAEAAYDLVTVSFVHLPREPRVAAYVALAAGVAPGGRLLVVAHSIHDLHNGVPRPPEPELFFTAAELAADVLDDGWELVTCEERPRHQVFEGEELLVHDSVLHARRLAR